MTQALRLWPLLTATHRYDKSLSTRNHGHGQIIEAPILAYLIETNNGRILFDVGCDYSKIANPDLRAKYYDTDNFAFGAPKMEESQRLHHHLNKFGLTPADVDVVFLSHLHFDHAGGLCDVCGTEIHVQQDELAGAQSGVDNAYFESDIQGNYPWKIKQGEYDLTLGVRAISTPGHTAGHMSMLIELPKGSPVILCGDAADLTENLSKEIAPGLCWQNREDLALESIRKLNKLASEEHVQLWPNHDMAFFRTLKKFPEFHD
jgi:N-acyl homoserine lactone hydrolase